MGETTRMIQRWKESWLHGKGKEESPPPPPPQLPKKSGRRSAPLRDMTMKRGGGKERWSKSKANFFSFFVLLAATVLEPLEVLHSLGRGEAGRRRGRKRWIDCPHLDSLSPEEEGGTLQTHHIPNNM